MTSPAQSSSPAYVFADDPAAEGATRHGELVDHLAAILDPFTTGRLTPLITPSSRCLEVAAGAGTIARWLAERTGEVVATDLDPSHIPAHPRLRVERHDLTRDPLPADHYDLIHARLVLGHLPTRQELISKLAAALAPGGALVVEEFQAAWDWCLMDAPDIEEAQRLFRSYHLALTATLTAAGTDTTWGRRAHRVMRQAGLEAVQTEFWARSWHGGEAGCMLPYAAAAQLRPKLLQAGMSASDIDAFRALLQDPRLVIHGNLAVSTCGRRAPHQPGAQSGT